MKQRQLGRSGLTVSEIGMGTMTFGSMADEAEGLRILDRAFDAGVDFIDIAEVYPVPPDPRYAGRTEEICGKWLASKPRDAVVVATKVAGPLGGWFIGPVRSGKTALDRHHIERACEDSLRRLGVDTIYLYQVHWPDQLVPMEDTAEKMQRLIDEGKIRAVGESNYSPEEMDTFSKAVRLSTAQPPYNLFERGIEEDILPFCHEKGIALLTYGALCRGLLELRIPFSQVVPYKFRGRFHAA